MFDIMVLSCLLCCVVYEAIMMNRVPFASYTITLVVVLYKPLSHPRSCLIICCDTMSRIINTFIIKQKSITSDIMTFSHLTLKVRTQHSIVVCCDNVVRTEG